MKADFYQVFGKESPEVGLAYLPEGFNFRAIPLNGPVQHWKPVKLELRAGTFTDFLGSDAIWHICSERMRGVIERFRHADDGMQWLEVEVFSKRAKSQPYFVLHFANSPDVINRSRSIIEPDGFIRKAVINARKAYGWHIFRLPNDRITLFVSRRLKNELEEHDCTGMDFLPAASAAES